MVCRGLSVASGFWNTIWIARRIATDRCPDSPGSGAPLKAIVPAAGRTSPAIARSSVDLPLPLSPAMPSARPAGTRTETPSTATNGAAPGRRNTQRHRVDREDRRGGLLAGRQLASRSRSVTGATGVRSRPPAGSNGGSSSTRTQRADPPVPERYQRDVRVARDRPVPATVGEAADVYRYRRPRDARDAVRRVVRLDRGYRGDQRRRVRVPGRARTTPPGRCPLDDLPGVHDGQLVADSGQQREVVAHVQAGEARVPDQGDDQAVDVRLGHHVQPGGRLVQDQHLGPDRQRQGQRDALLLPAAELVRVAAHRLLRLAGSPPVRATPRRAATPPRSSRPRCLRSTSRSWFSTVSAGLSEVAVSCGRYARRDPHTRRSSLTEAPDEVCARRSRPGPTAPPGPEARYPIRDSARVLLPEPDSPARPRMRPGSSAIETSASTWVSPSRERYPTDRLARGQLAFGVVVAVTPSAVRGSGRRRTASARRR